MCVLITSSGYFKALYEERAISESGARTVNIRELKPSTIRSILGFLYLGHIDLTLENVQSLLQGADYLLIDNLKDRIKQFLMESMNVDNSMDLMVTADYYHFEDLHRDTIELVRSRLLDYIIHTDMVSNLSDLELKMVFQQEQVAEIIDSDVMTELLLKWTKKNEDSLSESSSSIINKFILDHELDMEQPNVAIQELRSMIKYTEPEELHVPSCSKLAPQTAAIKRTLALPDNDHNFSSIHSHKKAKFDASSNELIIYHLSKNSDSEDEKIKDNDNQSETIESDVKSQPIFGTVCKDLEAVDATAVEMLWEEAVVGLPVNDPDSEVDIDLVIVNGLVDKRNFAYIVPHNRWVQLPDLPDKRTNHQMAHLGKEVQNKNNLY